MDYKQQIPAQPNLFWIYNGRLHESLDAATWLETSRALRNMGWRVTLVAAGPQGQHRIRGVEVTCVPRPERFLLRQLVFHLRVIRLLLKQWKSVDTVLFNEMSVLWLLPLIVLRNLRRENELRFVMDVRTVNMVPRTYETFRYRLRRVFQHSMYGVALRWADGYTAITYRMAKAVGLHDSRLLGIWPSGVLPTMFQPALQARNWPSADDTVRLTYVGSMHHERNLMALCRAVEDAQKQGMAFQLILVGDGSQRAELEQLAPATDGRVVVLRQIPHQQIPALLAQVHVGVLPFPDELKFQVSSPIKLFEYMAAGLPILATRISCHTDVIDDGKYVFWADGSTAECLTEALTQVWQRRQDLKTMGEEAVEAASVWTWDSAARKLGTALQRTPAETGDEILLT